MDFIKKEEEKLQNTIKKDEDAAMNLLSFKSPTSSNKSSDMLKDTGKKFALGLDTISDPFDENRKPIFNILGFTDISVVDFWAGFWTGIFGRDVRTEWHQCLGSPLKLIKDISDVSIEFMS